MIIDTTGSETTGSIKRPLRATGVLKAVTTMVLALMAHQAAASPFAAVLPTSRSVEVDGTATVFATILNPDDVTATNCAIQPATTQDADFFFQTTHPLTNELIGTINTAVDIPAGGSQSFVIGMIPRSEFGPFNVEFAFFCGNTGAAPVLEAINTLLLSGSTTPTADVVAVALTATSDGIANIPRESGFGFMSVATTNVGAGDAITATPVDVAGLDGTVLICETDQTTGACLADPGASTTRNIPMDGTATYSVFMSSATRVPLDPFLRRITLEFRDSAGVIRGRTGTAVAGGGPSALTFFTNNVADQIIQNTCVSCHIVGGEAQNSPLVFVEDVVAGYQELNKTELGTWLAEDPANTDVLLDRASGGGGHPQIVTSDSPVITTLTEAAFLILTNDDK